MSIKALLSTNINLIEDAIRAKVQCYIVTQTTLIYNNFHSILLILLECVCSQHLKTWTTGIQAFRFVIWKIVLSVTLKKANELETMQCPKWQDRKSGNNNF